MQHENKMKRLSLLLDWPQRDKVILLAFTTLPLILSWMGWVLLTYLFTDFGRTYLREEGVAFVSWWGGIVLLAWLLIGAYGLWLRRQGRDPSLYTTLVIFFYGTAMVPVGYAVGVMGPNTGVILLGASLVGFIMFDFLRVFGSFVFNLGLLVLVSVLTERGVLDYAPLFRGDPVSSLGSNSYWQVSQVFFATPFVATAFALTYTLLKRWKEREAEAMKLSHQDPMTGVANRLAIMDIVRHELASTRRNSRPFAVVMLDLDYLKSINDNYGQAAGDRVLVSTAAVLRETLRESDWVGRYGGEEFILVLPQSDTHLASLAVERVREAMAERSYDFGVATSLRVTASFGIYSVEGLAGSERPTIEEVLQCAEQALTNAKQAGRNCVRIWTPPGVAHLSDARLRGG